MPDTKHYSACSNMETKATSPIVVSASVSKFHDPLHPAKVTVPCCTLNFCNCHKESTTRLLIKFVHVAKFFADPSLQMNLGR